MSDQTKKPEPPVRENEPISSDDYCYGCGNWHSTINEWADIYTTKNKTKVTTEIEVGNGITHEFSSSPQTNHVVYVDENRNTYGFIVSREPEQKLLQCIEIMVDDCPKLEK